MRHFGRAIRARDRNAIASLRRAVGVVQQDCHLLDHLPLAENVALPLSVSGVAPADRADDVAALLAWVELGHRARALPAELTGGERRRAALARAVILSPELILADEPTGSVDRDDGARADGAPRRAQPHGQDRAGRHPRRGPARETACAVAARVLRLDEGRVWAARRSRRDRRTAAVWLLGDPSRSASCRRPAGRRWRSGFLAAVLAFFAVLALALALAAGRLAATWDGETGETATLQVFAGDEVIEEQARAALDVLRQTPGVRSVRMVDLAEQEKLLEPWLGPEVPMESLPLPLADRGGDRPRRARHRGPEGAAGRGGAGGGL